MVFAADFSFLSLELNVFNTCFAVCRQTGVSDEIVFRNTCLCFFLVVLLKHLPEKQGEQSRPSMCCLNSQMAAMTGLGKP